MKLAFIATMIRLRYLPGSIIAWKHSEPDRVDIIRTLFKGLHLETSLDEGRAQSDAERGFAR